MPTQHSTPRTYCPRCRHKLDGSISAQHDNVGPRAGDIAICVHCNNVNVYQKDGTLRSATRALLASLPLSVRIVLEQAQDNIVKLHNL